MSDHDLILTSLELCAEKSGDITPKVYEKFFDLCPSAHSLMGHSDEHMQGRMLEQVLELFVSADHLGEGGYLDWELDNHLVGYRVDGDMYVHFLHALVTVVRVSLAQDWSTNFQQAWDDRVAAIMQQVRVHAAVVGTAS